MQQLLIQRPETDRTFSQVVQLQKYYRQSLSPDSLRAAMQEAVRLATEMGMAGFTLLPQPVPTPPKKAKREVIAPRVKCETHFEKKFAFSDGTIWVSCTATGCRFGKGRKLHSDGSKSGTYLDSPEVETEVETEVEAVEPEELGVQELSLDVPVPIAGDEGDENDDSESDSESDIESDIEFAEPKDEDNEDEALAAYSNQIGGESEC